MRPSFSLTLLTTAIGLLLTALVVGFVFLRPMSVNFFHYLVWRLGSDVETSQGNVSSGDDVIHYVCYGEGPAVMLLHGGLSNRLIWFSQLTWLATSARQVVVIDTRGHGKSTLGDAELTYRLLASDAVAVLDQLRIRKTDVIGWSDGGNTALMLGRYWPWRVNRLVAISANFNPSGLTPEAHAEAGEESSGLGRWLSRWWTGAGTHLVELERRIKTMWQTRPNLQPVDLKAIEAPTLVIVGEKDDVMVSHATELAETLHNGKLAIIPGGHFTPLTHPHQVNELIADFLDIRGRNENSSKRLSRNGLSTF